LAQGQPSNIKVGDKVIVKHGTAFFEPTQLDRKGHVEDHFHILYAVTGVRPDHYLLSFGTTTGWVPAEAVIPQDGAIDYFTQQIEANPKATWPLMGRASIHVSYGQYSQAIADLDGIVRIDPKSTMALSTRGAAKQGLGDLDGAIADFTEILRLEPG